jgi:uncharacterized protein HemX
MIPSIIQSSRRPPVLNSSIIKHKKSRMKRIAVLALLAILSAAGSITVHAQGMTIQEYERQSQIAAKKQQKVDRKTAKKQRRMLRKAGKKQRKAMKRYQEAQRRSAGNVNRRWIKSESLGDGNANPSTPPQTRLQRFLPITPVPGSRSILSAE